MQIVRVERSHLPGLRAISNADIASSAANFMRSPESLERWRARWQADHERYPWLAAVESGEVLGFALAGDWGGRCAYRWAVTTSVYVAEQAQGRGCGRALYRELLATLAAQGYRTVIAGITLPNAASVALHEGAGFQAIGVFERIGHKFDRWRDVGYWQLHLGDAESPPADVLPVAAVWDPD